MGSVVDTFTQSWPDEPEFSSYSTLLGFFGLPYVRFFDKGVMYDHYRKKPIYPDKNNNFTVPFHTGDRSVKISLKKLHGFCRDSPWSPFCPYKGYQYKHLDYLGMPNYWLFDHGVIFSTDNMEYVNMYLRDDGFVKVQLATSDGELKDWNVHDLVATVFVPNKNNLPLVSHIDGDRTNNDASNLMWVASRNDVMPEVEDSPELCLLDDDEVTKSCKMIADNVSTDVIINNSHITKEALEYLKKGVIYRRISSQYLQFVD